MYPEEIEINEKTYKINTDYRYALACFEALEDEDINDIARAMALVSILLGQEKDDEVVTPDFTYEELSQAIPLLIKYLSHNEGEEETRGVTKRDMDFIQDRKYINASFMSDYRIDLDSIEMHWWKFCELLEGLTDKCVLNRVRDLRNTDLSEYKDSKTINKLQRAMQSVALKNKRTKEEQDAVDEFESLFK